MSEIVKPYKVQGTNYWTNLVDSNTGESVNFEEVTTWYDGTPMDDSKCDGEVYRKLPENLGGNYVVKVYNNFGEIYLEKDTIDAVRSLTSTERLLLLTGRYAGINVNGYYAKGDTGGSIVYKLYSGSEDDDGGEILDIGGGLKVWHDFNKVYLSRFFGVGLSGYNTGPLNTPRINAMIDAAARLGQKCDIVFQQGETILSQGGHLVPANINVLMYARLRENINGATPNTLMVIGSSGNTNSGRHIINIDRSTTNPRPDYENRDKVGVVIRNNQKSIIEVTNASLFGVAICLQGDESACTFNVVTLSRFIDNYINILLQNVGVGYANDNTFIGGSINNNSLWDQYIKYGVYFEPDNFSINNNRFIGTGFEGKNIWAVCARGAYTNKFENVRWEPSTFSVIPNEEGGFALEDPTTCRENSYEIGYQNPAVPLRIASLTNRPVLRSRINLVGGNNKYEANYLVATSGNLTNYFYKGNTDLAGNNSYKSKSPFFIISSSTGERNTTRYTSDDSVFSVDMTSVTCTGYAIASSLLVGGRKRLFVNVEHEEDGDVQRIGIIPYDSDGNRITSNSQVSVSTPQTLDVIPNIQSALYGGSWFFSNVDSVVVGLGDLVHHIDVFTNGVKLKSIRVTSPEMSEASDFYSEFTPHQKSIDSVIEVEGDYNLTSVDQIIAVNTTDQDSTITLPSTSYGQKVTIVDHTGNSSTNNITISGVFWDGDTSKVISTNFDSLTFVFLRGTTNGWIQL